MKFSHSLQFNAVPEWQSKYIAYTSLKKLIYELQREKLRSDRNLSHLSDIETAQSSLLAHDSNDASRQSSPLLVFIAALDAELRRIDAFYSQKSLEIFDSVNLLVQDVHDFEHKVQEVYDNSAQSTRVHSRSDGESDEDDDLPYTGDACSSRPRPSTADSPSSSKILKKRSLRINLPDPMAKHNKNIPAQLYLVADARVVLRKRIINLFTTILELKSFVELNYTGFKKAAKKFDKSLDTNIKEPYLAKLPHESSIFLADTLPQIDSHIDALVDEYALICSHADKESSRQELSVHLREHVVWERNTVWRDMIGLERKSQGVGLFSRRSGYTTNDDGDDLKAAAAAATNSSALPLSHPLNWSLYNPLLLQLASVVVCGAVLLIWSPFDDRAQKNCFALVICASILWATEAIPLFVTSLLIPLCIVILGVLKHPDGSLMDSLDSSRYILLTMWSSVILLLLGGFTLAAALSKYHIAKVLSTSILSRAGTNPPTVLFTVMVIAWFALMWVSNVAAPVLCFSLIQPLLRSLPRTSHFSSALILGIALASNIGGMALPIASPQNIIAIGVMDPAPLWGQWFVITTPVCILLLVLIWLFLVATFRFNRHNTQLMTIRLVNDKFLMVQWFIIFVCVLTIVLWCVALRLEGIFGEMGIIALIPMVLFFGSGLLTTQDFNNYPWNIVVLAMGGTALGKAVASSGLLATISVAIQQEVQDFLLFGVTLTFGFLILTMATFVSHTVAALIILPLVLEIGNKMQDPHPRLLIMASALLCSAAMGLPTLGFPNVTAICMTDDLGKPYLTVGTFITRGVPSSVFAYIVIVTIGYATMRLINF